MDRCSFCGRGRREVARLIEGPSAFICGECVLLCMEVLDDDGQAPLTDGQLLVRFSDGSAEICDQRLPWRPLVHEGYEFEWCGAQSGGPERVLALRLRGVPGWVVGAKLASEVSLTEEEARRVLEGVGGAKRLLRHLAGQRRVVPTRHAPSSAGWSGGVGRVDDEPAAARRPAVALDDYELAAELRWEVPRHVCEAHLAVPVSMAGTTLIVAMVDPECEASRRALAQVTRRTIEPVGAQEDAILRAIERLFGPS